METPVKQTPWQKCFARIGLSQAQLTKEMGFKNRSTVSRALRDEDGLITSRSQRKLLAVAKKVGRELHPSDLLPDD